MTAPVVAAYRHEALFYRGPRELIRWAAGFARDGIATDEPVLVALPHAHLQDLRRELGGEARQIELVDLTTTGRNPARIIAVWREFIDRHGGRPTRGIGEPAWEGRSAAELTECDHHEALLNVAFTPHTPFWLVCPYDLSSLDPATVEAARRNHPVVREQGRQAHSPAFACPDPADLLAHPLPLPPPDSQTLGFGPREIDAARALARRRAAEEGLAPDRVEELVLAVHEAAANSVRHGGGDGTLRLWREGGELICEVRDQGSIADPLLGRTPPPSAATGGRGLWLINQLCDLVELRSAAGATVVRMRFDAAR